MINHKCPWVASFPQELEPVQQAVQNKIDYNLVAADVKNLTKGLELIAADLAKCPAPASLLSPRKRKSIGMDSNEDTGAFTRVMGDFHTAALEKTTPLKASVVTLNEEYAKLLLQFGMKDGQIQDFLAMFASFIVDFKKCEGEVRQATELKRRKAAEQTKENGSTKNTDNTTPQKSGKG
jgi:hypothetical protein